MSKLLKSKIILGLVIVAVLFVGVAVVSKTQAASCSITMTLKYGMSGAEVMCLQSQLGVMPQSGWFGPITKSAVMAFQSAHGLTADGVFGPISRAAWMAGGSSTAGLPAGCTSTSGFSTTTGMACNSGSSLPAGCTSTAGYSPTTGMKCDSSAGASTGGALTGGAGSISDVNVTSSGTETTVAEGAIEKVYAFEVKADDNSDLAITSARVELDILGAGSTRLNHYADNVSIWMGSTKVGSLDADSFSRTNGDHTGTISLKNAIVKKGEKEKFYVGFQANDSIDSGADINDTIDVFVDSLRYNDATGAILTESGFDLGLGNAATVDFEDSTANDDIRLQTNTSNPDAAAVQVDTNDTSDATEILAFNLKVASDSSDMDVISLPVAITVTDPAGGIATTTIEKVISDIWLEVGSNTYDNSTPDGVVDDAINNTSKTSVYTFDIDEKDLTIDAGNTATVKVFVKFGHQDTKFDEGTVVSAQVTAADIDAEDAGGDAVTVTGTTADGEDQTLLVSGAAVSYVSSSYTAEDTSAPTDGTISLTFKVTAFGDDDVVIDENGAVEGGDTSDPASYDLTGASDTDSLFTCTGAAAVGGNYTVTSGSTRTCTLSVKFNTTTGFVRLELTSLDGSPVANVKTQAY